MMLPPKDLNVLSSMKERMLETKDLSPSVMITPEKPKKERVTTRMRHARSPNGYQRWKQRREGW